MKYLNHFFNFFSHPTTWQRVIVLFAWAFFVANNLVPRRGVGYDNLTAFQGGYLVGFVLLWALAVGERSAKDYVRLLFAGIAGALLFEIVLRKAAGGSTAYVAINSFLDMLAVIYSITGRITPDDWRAWYNAPAKSAKILGLNRNNDEQRKNHA